jgi:hypothetical protein
MDSDIIKKRGSRDCVPRTSRKTATTYSPTLSGSTIGADGLDFSVRNGKRYYPAAIAAAIYNLRETSEEDYP